ncbi:MAG: tetratricopeptide repeat protein [Candidatus Magnetomorum sp.]|nr:tetratricopeptide repeat protein [Candidatus Magnetomorum sp.]
MVSSKQTMIEIFKNKQTLFSLCLMIVLTLFAYLPIFQADFAGCDDTLYVTENDWVRSGLTLQGISWAFTHFHSANWHPLTWISHMLDCELYGMNATGHHLTNVILHMMNSVLVYLFFVLVTGAHYRSLALALLFALHPLHVESVAWISERKDVLSTFWGLLCLLAYYRYSQTFRRQAYSLMMVLFCLSLMSKPMLVTLPVLMIILDIWPLERNDARRFWDKMPLFIPVIGTGIVTYVAQLQDLAVNPFSSLCLSSRIINAFISSVDYLKKTVFPLNQSVLYPHPGNTMDWFLGVLCALLLLGLLIVCICQFKKMPFALTGYLWFFIALSPVIGIIQVGSQSMADRYTYVPHIGLFWAVIWTLASWVRNRFTQIMVVLIFCIACIGYGAKTYLQTQFWKDGSTLFTQAITNTQNNYIAYNNLGVCLFQKNQAQSALDHFNQSIAIEPNCLEARLNKAECLLALNKRQDAILEYQCVLKKSPDDIKAHLGLAELYRKGRQFETAIEQCQTAMKHTSAPEPVFVKLADIFEEIGELKKAAYFYHQALLLHSVSPITHYQYARVLVSLKKFQEAIDHYQQAIDLDPTFAKAYNSLGALYAWNDQIVKAFKYISIARKLAPKDQEILENYKKVSLLMHQ